MRGPRKIRARRERAAEARRERLERLRRVPGHRQNAGSRLHSAPPPAAHRWASNARPAAFACAARAPIVAPTGKHLFGEVGDPRALERLAKQGERATAWRPQARDVPAVRVSSRADVHVVVAHALVDVAAVLGLGGDLGVDALLERREAPRAPAPRHARTAALGHASNCFASTLSVRAHLAERLEATAEDRARGGAESVERRRDDGQRHGPRRAVPEAERRLQRGGYSPPGAEVARRPLPATRFAAAIALIPSRTMFASTQRVTSVVRH